MTKEIKNTVIGFADHGLFVPLAQKLAEQVDRVYYWSPSDAFGPKLAEGIIGYGFDKIIRVKSLWEVRDEIDVYVFPDVGFGGMQQELVRQGKPVWGHHGGDVIETNRGLFLQLIQSLGMPTPNYEVIRGLTALRSFLKNNKDKYVKITRWRGDWETLHWRSWKEDEAVLDMHAHLLGPAKEMINFFVFDSIEADIEDGIDTYCIDGNWPKTVIHGMEKKDRSFLCSVQPLQEIDESVRMVNEKMGPELAKYGYRGFFSSEVRIADGKSYFIDPTCRAASPPSQVMSELFGNMAEIIIGGAYGVLIEPQPTADFGVQALLTVNRKDDDWTVLDLDPKLKQWVKCGFSCQVKGQLVLPPSPLHNMLGWLCATGDTIEIAIDTLRERAKLLPDGIDCDWRSLSDLLDEAKKAQEEGILLSDQPVPKPEIILKS